MSIFYLQSPKYAPPVEFVDQAALSPPEGYKDGGLQQALGGVLGSHIFGAQHMQQLQVIQRLQAKRAAMLAAQQRTTNNGTKEGSSSKVHPAPPPPPSQTICTECAECTECAAKQEHDEGTSFSVFFFFFSIYFNLEISNDLKEHHKICIPMKKGDFFCIFCFERHQSNRNFFG